MKSTGSPAKPSAQDKPADAVLSGPAADIPNFYTPGHYGADESVGHLMRRVTMSILALADRQLAQHDLTFAQWMPLYKLALHQGGTVAALARDLCVDAGAVTRSLDRLEAKGLIVRERSREDRRVVNLALTPEGHAVADKVPAVMATVLNAHLAGFTESEWRLLLGMLQRMAATGDTLRGGAPLPPLQE